ncbi:hypothetical protein J1C67_02380 [Clostridium gasigenes]|uniref:hypothetical protein n=1 Tax=Clostridium gasigenes TaxID=94869 RepID=UPI0014385239|nr:hypothetical protein [Clostridium gasigenes]NKF06183.1 hypothetical protein [Clostridium gasigenes]QSW20070.1 hypothetical protein J1C67_02380 [Clostridium gasigenes]
MAEAEVNCRNKLKSIVLPVLTIIIIVSIGYNIYQDSKIKRYKEELGIIVSQGIESFASKSGSLSDELVYAEQYGDIASAHMAYVTLSEGDGISSEEYTSSLAMLLLNIKILMLNDKSKVEKALLNNNGSELMFRISNNFEDTESIEKVFKLLE